MVFVNSKKYACESCIKGHRSSSCHHNDRPLFEIKKKGRPVSQCEKCREARHTRRIHAKCTCDAEQTESSAPDSSSAASTSKKGKRFVPTVPTLPNGLQDALRKVDSTSQDVVDPRQRVDSLLNPCHCKSVWDCKCHTKSNIGASTSKTPMSEVFSDGLSALAHVAACCSPATSVTSPPGSSERSLWLSASGTSRTQIKYRSDCPHGHSTSAVSPKKIAIPRNAKTSAVIVNTGSTLQPVRLSPPSAGLSQRSPPIFPVITPSVPAPCHAVTSCGCGHRCECPGCALHQDANASGTGSGHARTSCSHDCTTCVDHNGGIELPGHATPPTFIDQFFARAAMLPSPPNTRSTSIDPMNVTVYPRSIITGAPKEGDARGLAFGLVQVPKLECCGGQCSCPEGKCICGTDCGGCCSDDAESTTNVHHPPASAPPAAAISFARQAAIATTSASGTCSSCQ